MNKLNGINVSRYGEPLESHLYAGRSCVFKTGKSCCFKTRENCIFDVYDDATLRVGSDCILLVRPNNDFRSHGYFLDSSNYVVMQKGLKEIKNVNYAILNFKHRDKMVRELCKVILEGKEPRLDGSSFL